MNKFDNVNELAKWHQHVGNKEMACAPEVIIEMYERMKKAEAERDEARAAHNVMRERVGAFDDIDWKHVEVMAEGELCDNEDEQSDCHVCKMALMARELLKARDALASQPEDAHGKD